MGLIPVESMTICEGDASARARLAVFLPFGAQQLLISVVWLIVRLMVVGHTVGLLLTATGLHCIGYGDTI
jgi:hypothetical protein